MGTQSKAKRRKVGRVKPITGVPVQQQPSQEEMQAAMEANLRQLKEIFGRVPLGMDGLVRLVNESAWPQEVLVNPLDFLFLSNQGVVVHKDSQGPYFYLSVSKVRPAAGNPETIDLSGWEPEPPSRIKLVAPNAAWGKVD